MDAAAGYAVLEDMGDDLYANVIGKGAEEIPLYQAAAELLAHVHAAAGAGETGRAGRGGVAALGL